MNSTLLLGVAAVLDAIGSVLASHQHFYSAYILFAVAILMALAAIGVTYRTEYRKTRGREELGRLLLELSECRRLAYDGLNRPDYERLYQRVEQIKKRVRQIAAKYLDSSFEARFLAVTVLDFPLDEAMKKYFADKKQIEFQQVFQNVQAWRVFLNDVLAELR